MNNWQDWVWRSLLGLVIVFFGGQLLASVATYSTLAIPPVADRVFCPDGFVARINPAPFKASEGFGIICYDGTGAAKVVFAHTDIWELERDYFHVPSYAVVTLLVVGWYVRKYARRYPLGPIAPAPP